MSNSLSIPIPPNVLKLFSIQFAPVHDQINLEITKSKQELMSQIMEEVKVFDEMYERNNTEVVEDMNKNIQAQLEENSFTTSSNFSEVLQKAKFRLVILYLEGQALQYYHFLIRTNDAFERLDWNDYLKLIKYRITLDGFDEQVAKLIAIQQTNSNVQYHEEFIQSRAKHSGDMSNGSRSILINCSSTSVTSGNSCSNFQRGQGQESNFILSFNFNTPHLNSLKVWEFDHVNWSWLVVAYLALHAREMESSTDSKVKRAFGNIWSNHLKKIRMVRAFKDCSTKKLQFIAKAHVEFERNGSGVSCDISLVVDRGQKVVYSIAWVVQKCPQLRLLCLILKVLLQQRDLNGVYFGGIVSCALLPMIKTMLQNLCNSQAILQHYLRMLLQFLEFDPWGQVSSVAGGIVTTEEEIGELGAARSIEENKTEEGHYTCLPNETRNLVTDRPDLQVGQNGGPNGHNKNISYYGQLCKNN
ncbi:hypothetical protein GQ457_14G011960 [Hibiscus cannabinus]